MLSFREIQNCEGYYYNVETGEILRNVGPGESRCWSEGSWRETTATDDPNAPEFELLTVDVLTPFEVVREMVVGRHGGPAPRRLLNRQAAIQPEGDMMTEEAAEELETGRSARRS